MATTKITKRQAKRLYEKGEKIILNPSKMRMGGHFSMAMETTKKQSETPRDEAQTFEALCNSFSYYNCTKETGNVIHFYRED